MLERLVLPPWLKAGLALPLLVLNLWVLRQLLLLRSPCVRRLRPMMRRAKSV